MGTERSGVGKTGYLMGLPLLRWQAQGCAIFLCYLTTVEGVNGDRLEFNYKQGVSKIFSEALNINSAVEDLVYYEGERRECNLQIC